MGCTEFFNGAVVILGLLVAVLALELGAHGTTLEAGRNLVEGENSSQSSRTLARTERVDPLDKFKKYKGGYDITNKHYWSSTIFTGVYGYSIAALWLMTGLVYAGFLLATTPCFTNNGRKEIKRVPCTKRYCLWPMPVGVSFTLLAIVASGVVLAGSSRSHSRANSVKNIIRETAQRASGTIYNVTRAVRTMQEDTELYGDLERSTRLNSTSRKLNTEASRIQKKAEKNVWMIGSGLKILHSTTAVIVSLNMVAILALLGSGFLKLRRPFHLLIILCWLLAFLCWMYFGLYFFLDRFAGDTCVALDEFRHDPRNSSLSSILPCNNQLSTKLVLRDTRAGIHNLIQQVNANISMLQSSTLKNRAFVCNPFSAPPDYDYQAENCSANATQIGDIPQILKRYACTNRDGGTCGEGEFISASDYSRVLIYTTSVQNLLDAFPGVESLVNCQLVKDAFSDILSKQCKPLEKCILTTWAAMVVLSTTMAFLVLTWAIVAHHDGEHHSSDGSVNPHSAKLSDTQLHELANKHTGPKLEP